MAPNCVHLSNPYHRCTQACIQTKTKRSSGHDRSVTDGQLGKKINNPKGTYAGCPKAHNPYHECDDYCYQRLLDSGALPPLKLKRKNKLVSKPEPLDVNHEDQPKDGTGEEEEKIGIVPITEADDEGRHMSSEGHVQVGKYQIKGSFGSILQSIIDNYGDIGENCELESVAMRSYYIECVCFVVQELQYSSSLSKTKLKELLAILKDAESAQFHVAWLRSALDENIELINRQQEVEALKDNSARQLHTLRQELQSDLETLAYKEQEIANIQTRIPQIRDRLTQLELKSQQLNQTTLSIISKLDHLHIKSLVNELL